MQAKAIRNYHLHHPFDDSPATLQWPTDLPETVASSPTSHATARNGPCKRRRSPRYGTLASRLRTPSSNPTPPQPHHLQSRQSERGRKEAHPPPAPNKPEMTAGQQPPNPPNAPDPPDKPGVHPAGPPPPLDQASSSSSLLPQAPPKPETFPEFQRGTNVQQPFRNDHMGYWICCEGTIQKPPPGTRPRRGGASRSHVAPPEGATPRQQRPGQAHSTQRPTKPTPSGASPPRRRPIEAPSTPGSRASPRQAYSSAHHLAKRPWAPKAPP